MLRTHLTGRLVFFLLLISLAGCTCSSNQSDSLADSAPSGSPVSFVSQYAPIEFIFPPGWYENPKEHPYDLQCFSPKKRMNTGVFAFRSSDIASDSTPYEIYKIQIEDLMGKRRNVEILDEEKQYSANGKNITTIAYTADKDHLRYCYKFTLIEFNNKDTFAVSIQIGLPGEWATEKTILEEITHSAQLTD